MLGGSRRRYASIGDLIVVLGEGRDPQRAASRRARCGAAVRGAHDDARSRAPDGSFIRFDDNAAVLIDNAAEPIGTRIFGPVARELRAHKFMKIISLAPEVL